MLVRELIEYLKPIPGGTPVIVMDYEGKPTSYVMLKPTPDGICFEGIPEPDTEFYKSKRTQDDGGYMICGYDAYFNEFSSDFDCRPRNVVRWVLIGEVVSMIDSLSSIKLVKLSDEKTNVASE